MATKRKFEHEVTLLAFDADRQLVDIVETCRHYASHFTRAWVTRNADVHFISALHPGQSFGFGSLRRIREVAP